MDYIIFWMAKPIAELLLALLVIGFFLAVIYWARPRNKETPTRRGK